MLVLSATTKKIQVVLAGSVTANQLQCYASWRDRTSTTFVAGDSQINTNDTTDVDLVAAPGADTQRLVDYISVYNADTVTATVTVKLDVDSTEYILTKQYLSAGQTLTFVEGFGWNLTDVYRPMLVIPIHNDAGANFAMTNATQAERFAGNTTRHIARVDLTGYNQVRMSGMVMVGSASANTPKFRAKYYTSYSATVGNYLTLGATEVEYSVVNTGFLDTGWINLVAGAKADIYLGFTELGGDAVADPALGSTYISFR